MTDFNEYAKKHGARKEVYDEGLKLKYQNKSAREYTASIYGLPYQPFPPTQSPARLAICNGVHKRRG